MEDEFMAPNNESVEMLQRAKHLLACENFLPGRYVFFVDGWHSATPEAMIDLERFYHAKNWILSLKDAVAQIEKDFPEAMVAMPSWWHPNNPVVERGFVPGEREPRYFPLRNAISHGCAPLNLLGRTLKPEKKNIGRMRIWSSKRIHQWICVRKREDNARKYF